MEWVPSFIPHFQIHAIKQYSRKLKEILPIHWKVEGKGEGRCGVLSLDGLCLPVASVAVMKPHPILFSELREGKGGGDREELSLE